MIKLVVNSPKGGVGKTTISINVALLLAREGKRVKALDLAQGSQMTNYLSSTPEFNTTDCQIETTELGSLPSSFKGAHDFDYLVVDTDDYYHILTDLVEKKKKGWRVIAPIVPSDFMGLQRIPNDIAAFVSLAMIQGEKIPIRILMNKMNPADIDRERNIVFTALHQVGISTLLSNTNMRYCNSPSIPLFIEDDDFKNSLKQILTELGVNL